MHVARKSEPGERARTRTRDCAILFADVAGYSRMMGRDEPGTLEFIVGCSHFIGEASGRHRGDLVQTTGDGFLLLFDEPIDAIDFGVELHQAVAKRQGGVDVPAQFRVGIHHGQVHIVAGTIHGHAVNVAARLQAEALPGTCVVSQIVYDRVRSACNLSFESIGRPALKNIAERISLYRTSTDPASLQKPAAETISISVVGPLTVRGGSQEQSFPAGVKSSALLGYLSLHPGMREHSDKIARLLWPEASMAAARRSLAACRRRLADALGSQGPRLFFSTGQYVGLNELHFDTDLDLVLKDVRRGRVPDLLLERPDWPSRILEGLEEAGKVYANWLDVTRAMWRNRILRELSALLERCPREDESCRDAALAILAVEPGNEAASAALMRHFAARGNRAAALNEHSRLEAYLTSTFGVRPGAVAADAFREIVEDAPRPAPRLATPARTTDTRAQARLVRIALSPFRDADGEHGHLIAGFRNELLANLARFREWSVIEGEGVLREVGSEESAASRAVCHYIVQGEYREAAPPVLNIRLRDLSHGRVIWSDNIALDLDRWKEAQREVISRIAAHLDTYISADRLANLVGEASHDSTVHDAWLQAEAIFARWSPEAADEAEARLQALISRDPAFAPAYSSLASFRNVRHIVRPGLARDAENERAARQLAERAVELDPLDARNHLAVAWTAALTGDFGRAMIHFDLAASLNPNSALTLVSCAMGYAFAGEAERGETLVAHVLRVSPILSEYQWCYVASVHFLAGRYEEALQAARRSGDRIIDDQGWIAASLVQLGRLDEAREAARRLVEAVRPVWAGSGPATDEALLGWFTNAYPMRKVSDRGLIAGSLNAALGGR